MLYVAVIYLCMAQIDKCMEVTDTRGPYQTVEECKNKLEYMVGLLRRSIPMYWEGRGYCIKIEKDMPT